MGPELEGAVCGSEIGSDLRIGYLEPFGLKHSLCACVTVQEATQRGEEKGPRKGLNRSGVEVLLIMAFNTPKDFEKRT